MPGPKMPISSPTSLTASRFFQHCHYPFRVGFGQAPGGSSLGPLPAFLRGDMGLEAEPRKARHSVLTVAPFFQQGRFARVAPDSGPSGSTFMRPQHVLHVRGEAAGVGEGVDTHLAVQQGSGGAVLDAELAVQAAAGHGTGMAPGHAAGWLLAQWRRGDRPCSSRRFQGRLNDVLHI